MKTTSFQHNNGAGYQMIWIEDQAPRVVGPDLDPFRLQRSLMSNKILEIVRKYFNFVQELLEDTVHTLL